MKSKVDSKSFKTMIISLICMSGIIVTVGMALLFSGYQLSASWRFVAWCLVILCFLVAVIALINLLVGFIPNSFLRRNGEKLVKGEDAAPLADRDTRKNSFVNQYVNAEMKEHPVYEVLETIFSDKREGESIVLAYYCCQKKNLNWLIGIPGYKDSCAFWGKENVGISVSTYSYHIKKAAQDKYTPIEIDNMTTLLQETMKKLSE